jgi:hypothetical protein
MEICDWLLKLFYLLNNFDAILGSDNYSINSRMLVTSGLTGSFSKLLIAYLKHYQDFFN